MFDMNRLQWKADFIMVIVTIFWGSSYIFMKMGLDTLEEFNLIALRFGLAFIIAGIFFYRRMMKLNYQTMKYSFLLGSILFLLFASVTFGVKLTSASNAGFLVSLTVIFVPLLLALYLKKLPEKRILSGVVVAFIGIALLTLNSSLQINSGDILCILAAFFFAIHIILTGKVTKHVDSISLGVWQLGIAGGWGFIFSLFFETPQLPSTTESWISILGLGVLCSAIGFVAQTSAQKYTTPTHTSLIFSLEPVFAALFAFLFAGEYLSTQGLVGAILVLLGVLIAEVNLKSFFTKKKYHSKH